MAMTDTHIPVNMYEADDALVVVAPLPAVMPEDVTVELRGGQLTINAVQRTDAPKDYVLHEWTYGPYERTLDVPDGFGRELQATMANGQLAIRVLRGEPSSTSLTANPTKH